MFKKFSKNLEIFDDVIMSRNLSAPLVINRHHLETPSPLGDDIM
jgi:hypothetical protein